jgi:hypothetical protein
MTVESTSAEHALALDLVARMNNFLSDLWEIPAVRLVGIRSEPAIEVWVLLDHEDVSLQKRILRQHWLEFERGLAPSVALHLASFDHVERDNLPATRVIFER